MDLDTTYRVIDLSDRQNVGQTALSPELAKLATTGMWRSDKSRMALERTDWVDEFGKPKPRRTVVIEAEEPNGLWTIGS